MPSNPVLHWRGMRPPLRRLARLACIAPILMLGACATAPVPPVPEAPVPVAFRSQGVTWLPAAPADALDRGPWWELFGDAELNRLAGQVQLSNQNIAAAAAAVEQAQAQVRLQRAGLLPSVSASAGATRTGGEGAARPGLTTQANLGVDWAPDVWGRLRSAVDSATAGVQASQADLASARLSAVGALAAAYFQVREADAEIALLETTVEGYERSLRIARNRYAAGVIGQTDVLQAQTQRANALADLASVRQTRTRLEHAMAVLVGQSPSTFSVPAAVWQDTVPAIPVGIPSELLQRRPDIAAAERALAAAQAQIGVQQAGYFPSVLLRGSAGTGGSSIGDVLRASTVLWSLGLSVAQTVFDAGATAARVDQAQAARDARAANYRQVVLTAFQGVEDQLTALRTLAEQAPLRQEVVSATGRTAEQQLNRYQAGQVSYSEVVTAQAAALAAQRAMLQLQVNRQLATIALVQALGGGWTAPWAQPAKEVPAAPR